LCVPRQCFDGGGIDVCWNKFSPVPAPSRQCHRRRGQGTRGILCYHSSGVADLLFLGMVVVVFGGLADVHWRTTVQEHGMRLEGGRSDSLHQHGRRQATYLGLEEHEDAPRSTRHIDIGSADGGPLLRLTKPVRVSANVPGQHTWPWAARPEARPEAQPEKLGPVTENVGPTPEPGRAWVARKCRFTLRPGPRPDGPTCLVGIWSGPGLGRLFQRRAFLGPARPDTCPGILDRRPMSMCMV
jgi:hypothetical protein